MAKRQLPPRDDSRNTVAMATRQSPLKTPNWISTPPAPPRNALLSTAGRTITTLAVATAGAGSAISFAAVTPERHGFAVTALCSVFFGWAVMGAILVPFQLARQCAPEMARRFYAVMGGLAVLVLVSAALWCLGGGPDLHLDTLFGL
jgi:hypothetical protein